MTEIELPLTNKCNWHCDYCVADIHNQPELPYEEVLRRVHLIRPGTEVTFGGGEPGLLKREQLEEIIRILKDKDCVIDLLTNGLFFKRHMPLISVFGKIHYHCVEYLPDDIEFPDLQKDYDHIFYALVVTNTNFLDGSIHEMIRRYPHIKFLLLPDVRSQKKISLNLMMKFFDEHGHKVHPGSLQEFITVVSRWH
jgi:organic radical activating enzyme